MKATLDTSGKQWTVYIEYDPHEERRRVLAFVNRIFAERIYEDRDTKRYGEDVFERSEPLPVLHNGVLYALSTSELECGQCSRCGKYLGDHAAAITYSLGRPKTWSVRLLCSRRPYEDTYALNQEEKRNEVLRSALRQAIEQVERHNSTASLVTDKALIGVWKSIAEDVREPDNADVVPPANLGGATPGSRG